MKNIERDGSVWSIAESERDKTKLTEAVKFLQVNGINHSVIYSGPTYLNNPLVEELAIIH